MNRYESNYWGVYFDYLHLLRTVTFSGLSLSLCSHFYSLINHNKPIEKALASSGLRKHIQHPCEKKEDLQPIFETFLPPVSEKKQAGKGKVVLYTQLLRIPHPLIQKYLQAKEIIYLKKDAKTIQNRHSGMIIDGLNLYKGSVNPSPYIKKTIRLLKSVKHPVFGNRNFQEKVTQEISKHLPYLAAVKQFLDTHSVSVIILGETNNPETRAFAVLARERGIPTISLQHGAIALEFGYLPKIATIQGVYGAYEKGFYKERGVKTEEIEIVGHPRFDEIYERKPMLEKAFHKKVGVSNKKPKILFIAHHRDNEKLFAIVKQLVRNKVDADLIVKLRSARAPFKKLENQSSNIRLVRRMHLYDLLPHVDAVVSYESTVVLEALLIGKPVFVWTQEMASKTDYFHKLVPTCYENPEILTKDLMNWYNMKANKKEKVKFSKDFYLEENALSISRMKYLIDRIRS